MNVLWVFAHPEPRSLNGALRDFGIETLQAAGHEVRQSDLYAMRWKAVADAEDFTDTIPGERLTYAASSYQGFKHGTQAADVAAEQAKVMWADAVIVQYPLWWFSTPAILKGWFDRILAAGWAYRVTDPANPKRNLRYGDGNLKGKRGLQIVTTGATAASLGPRGVAGDINDLLFPVNYGVFWYTGMSALPPHVIHGANRVSLEEYARLEADLAARLATLATATPIPYRSQNGGDYDDDLVLKPGLGGARRGWSLRVRDDS
ncbi:MAG: NAD(P)H-dependent oxidoreductase [Hyphomicrobiaceae bacterium]